MPHYSFLKPFGCACFPHLGAASVDKLSPHSVKCVFLGYAPHYKGYKCLDPISHRVYISHHVRFYETEFPFQTLTTRAPSLQKAPSFPVQEIMSLTPTHDVVPLHVPLILADHVAAVAPST